MKKRLKNHPFLYSILLALLVGWGMILIYCIGQGSDVWECIQAVLAGGTVVAGVLVYPFVLTVINLVGIFRMPITDNDRWNRAIFESLTWFLGITYTLLYLSFSEVGLGAQWTKQLANEQMHQPIWSGGMPTVITLAVVGFMGYLILSLWKLEKLPPLVAVLSIAGMYLGVIECIVWCVQVGKKEYFLLLLFPVNVIFMIIGLIRRKVIEWNQMQNMAEQNFAKAESTRPGPAKPEPAKQGVLSAINRLLKKAQYWPLLALLAMLPLLGILLGILILFGQRPDAIIKAWTETADWRLSQQIAPPNVMYDEHYLCTVAAGGHEKVVKPIRMGERHGHRVVVNRQLCIANAFEQILEERTPRFHRAIRHFYDTYGFPVARLIRTKAAADVVYFLMKPLEWIFLLVLYLCDTKPENRIAVQYLPKSE